jgi:hypothetical protein
MQKGFWKRSHACSHYNLVDDHCVVKFQIPTWVDSYVFFAHLGNLEVLFEVLFRVGTLLPLLSSLLVQKEKGIITWWKTISDYRWGGWIWPRCSCDGQQFQNII